MFRTVRRHLGVLLRIPCVVIVLVKCNYVFAAAAVLGHVTSARTANATKLSELDWSCSILPVLINVCDCDVILPGYCYVLVKVSSVDLHVITDLRDDWCLLSRCRWINRSSYKWRFAIDVQKDVCKLDLSCTRADVLKDVHKAPWKVLTKDVSKDVLKLHLNVPHDDELKDVHTCSH